MNLAWVHSLRKIVDKEGFFVCNDDCESLGWFQSVLGNGDVLVDTSCYVLTRELAVEVSPLWYRKARQPGVLPADRSITMYLLRKDGNFDTCCSGKYSVNYRLGSRRDSVQKEFFLLGNEAMIKAYPNGPPWRK